jgi:hypothetical protein
MQDVPRLPASAGRPTAASPVEPLENRRLFSAGGGLTAQYFADQNLAHSAITRVDPAVDFQWGRSGPSSQVPADHFSARWIATLTPRYTQTYTFRTVADDGIRLWVDGRLLIDRWHDHAPTAWAARVGLDADHPYALQLEYYHDRGPAVARLFWSSRSQKRQVIPSAQLTPAAPLASTAPLASAASTVSPDPVPEKPPVPLGITIPPQDVQTWGGPIVITHGGTYSGSWQSLDPHTPAVKIDTAEPVIIESAFFRSAGDCISEGTDHVNLTVRNSVGYSLNPNIAGRAPGRFVSLEHFNSVDLENNTLDATAGIYLGYYEGDHSAADTVKVIANAALNVDGRHSDGQGGFLTGPADYDDVQFCQIAYTSALAGVEIAWNEVVNVPRQSRVEDNISIYRSSGTAASPIDIHDNFIYGGYPADPSNPDYSGGGIMLGDGVGATLANACGYVVAHDNQVIATTNYGIAIAAGHDSSFYNNRIVSSGVLSDGTRVAGQNTGAYVWNGAHDLFFANNSAYDNTIGWMAFNDSGQPARNDHWLPDAKVTTGNVSLPGPITLQTEAAEYPLFAQKLSAAGITVGAV